MKTVIQSSLTIEYSSPGIIEGVRSVGCFSSTSLPGTIAITSNCLQRCVIKRIWRLFDMLAYATFIQEKLRDQERHSSLVDKEGDLLRHLPSWVRGIYSSLVITLNLELLFKDFEGIKIYF